MSKVFTIAEGLENMGAIKTGGQGSVYKGRRVGEIITAIKLLPTPVLSPDENDKHYRDFSSEVKKLQRVNEEPHPNIVKILSYGVSETGGFPYIEMEYIDGPDLAELLKPPHEPVFTIKEAIKVAEQLSHALAHCHRLDVKHGDIKSNNVKYNRQTGNYMLLDFGLAILSDEERRTSLRRAGAIEFMAPEQNEGKMLFETDVYSFGIVLFELLAGIVPFPLDGNTETARNKVMLAHMEAPPPDLLSLRAERLPQSWPEEKKMQEMQVPDWIISVLSKCLEKDPGRRFANGMALHEEVCHHRIYAENSYSATGGEALAVLLAQKEKELAALQEEFRRRDDELPQPLAGDYRQSRPVPVQKTVSKAAFYGMFVAMLLASALALYGWLGRRPVVEAAHSDAVQFRTRDHSAATAKKAARTETAKHKKAAAVAKNKAAKPTDTLVRNDAAAVDSTAARKAPEKLRKLPPKDSLKRKDTTENIPATTADAEATGKEKSGSRVNDKKEDSTRKISGG